MNETNMQHGYEYFTQNIKGWYATEKYDGCRAYWDGFHMWSRGGLQIKLPQSWRQILPVGIHFDGEIYDGVDGVYRCGAAVKYGHFLQSMSFMVFDAPLSNGNYLTRMEKAQKFSNNIIKIIKVKVITSLKDAVEMTREIIDHKGEGIMVRHPQLQYIAGRTDKLLKLKASILGGQLHPISPIITTQEK